MLLAVETRGTDSLRGKPPPLVLGLMAGFGAGLVVEGLGAGLGLGLWEREGVESRDELPPPGLSSLLTGFGPMAARGLDRPRALSSERGFPVNWLR